MAMQLDSQKALKIHDEAIRNFRRIQSALYNERQQSLEDRRFYSIAGAQWEGALTEVYENKPKFEVNKIHLAVMKIINEYRANRISVKFISKDGSKNDALADTCNGLFRADEQDSTANEAYDNGFEEAVGGGMGALRVITEYEDEYDDENENQRIRIEPIQDADTSVYFDLDAKRYDKSDAKYCYVMWSQTPEDFKEEWGADALPSPMPKRVDQTEYDWYTPDLVYYAEYYRVEEKKHTVYVFSTLTGEEERYTDEDFEDDPELRASLEASGKQEVRQKKVKKRVVHKYIISGDRILEDCGIIAGPNIPIVPIYGKRWFVDSIERVMGHVRLVKDTQRLKNMMISMLAEIAASGNIQAPIMTPEQVKGFEHEWAERHLKNLPYLLINPITDAEGNEQSMGPVDYTKNPEVPPALASLMQLVDIDQKELMGNDGEPDKLLSHVSAKAHERVQKRIDGQAYIYMSNLAKSIRRLGEIWLGMAKEVYVETGRKMKTIDPLGEISQVTIGEMNLEDGIPTETNDLSKASFDVWVDIGPSSSSQREATVDTLMGMMQFAANDPSMMQVLSALALMNVEGEGISETRAFFRKKLVEMGVLPPTPEEAEAMAQAADQPPSPQDQYFMAEANKANADATKKQAEIQKIAADTRKTDAETLNTLDEVNLRSLVEVLNFQIRMQEEQRAQEEARQQIMQNQVQQLEQQTGVVPPQTNPGAM